jgi:predicted nuclease of predicted toxin-antitoxin system
VAKFLLHENLSPRVAKHLARAYELDAIPLSFVAREGTADTSVRSLARRLERVIITLDRDFAELANTRHPTPPGILWLNPPQSLRTVEGAIRLLD